MVVATVIQLSTRGTVGSDNWFMGLAEQPVPRSYHLQDNDWTPLSQNLCWKATIYPPSVFTRSDRPRPNTKLNRLSGIEGDKSFVDDFDLERGTVRVRVGLSYDPLRLSPLFWRFVMQIARTLCISSIHKSSRTPTPHKTSTKHKRTITTTMSKHTLHNTNKHINQSKTKTN
jgi:hypothetical protein